MLTRIQNMFRTVIVVYAYCLISTHIGSSADMPPCESKETCNNLWNVPNISNCIQGTCQCTGDSVYVEKSNRCKCQEGYVIGSKKCLPVASGLQSACDEDVQCSKLGELAVCVNYQCYCRRGTTSVNGICQNKKYIGEDCKSNDECQHINNLVCKDNICTCAEGFVPNTDDKSCLPLTKNFWSSCVDDIQCHQSFGEGSRCLTKCVCKNEYHNVNDTVCIKNKVLGEECIADYECYLEGDIQSLTVSCQRGICTCKEGYNASSNNFSCERDAGGSVCLKPISFLAQTLIVIFIICLNLILR